LLDVRILIHHSSRQYCSLSWEPRGSGWECSGMTLTKSEVMFEKCLEDRAITYDRLPELSKLEQKQPDYQVQRGNLTCVFEVKELIEPRNRVGGKYPITAPIRGKIKEARKQFEQYEQCCCAVVLYNTGTIRRSVEFTSVMSAAFGTWDCLPDPLNDQPPAYEFSGFDSVLSQAKNTRISAVLVLAEYALDRLFVDVWKELQAKRKRGEPVENSDCFDLLSRRDPGGSRRVSYQGTIRVIAVENPYARVPFPAELFIGPFDQRWRRESKHFRLVFVGSELEKLRTEGVPHLFL
jgi:hypothetical protein